MSRDVEQAHGNTVHKKRYQIRSYTSLSKLYTNLSKLLVLERYALWNRMMGSELTEMVSFYLLNQQKIVKHSKKQWI